MLARLLLLARLLCMPTLGSVIVLAPLSAYAQDEEEEEGAGDAEEGDGEEEETAEDKEQPPVTAGGLYTLESYPQSELERPLTMTQNIFEARAGLEIDLTKDHVFETWTVPIDLRYGLRDNLELDGGAVFRPAAPSETGNPVSFYLGGELAIVYDLVDFRAAGMLTIPTIEGADTAFDIEAGFPVKFRIKDKIAIVALDRIIRVHTDGRDPDLTISVGGIIQIAPPLAVIGKAELNFNELSADSLDPEGGGLDIPASVGAQFSPNGQFDIGLEIILGNLKAPEGASPIDRRSVLIFARMRVGK